VQLEIVADAAHGEMKTAPGRVVQRHKRLAVQYYRQPVYPPPKSRARSAKTTAKTKIPTSPHSETRTRAFSTAHWSAREVNNLFRGECADRRFSAAHTRLCTRR
jgi:hypothetical protein